MNLINYKTGETIRTATQEEIEVSAAAPQGLIQVEINGQQVTAWVE